MKLSSVEIDLLFARLSSMTEAQPVSWAAEVLKRPHGLGLKEAGHQV